MPSVPQTVGQHQVVRVRRCSLVRQYVLWKIEGKMFAHSPFGWSVDEEGKWWDEDLEWRMVSCGRSGALSGSAPLCLRLWL